MPDPAPLTLESLAEMLATIAGSIGNLTPEGLGPENAAKFCGVSVSKWHEMNDRGMCPAPAELGDRCPRWCRSELKAWLLAGGPHRSRWIHQRDVALRRAG